MMSLTIIPDLPEGAWGEYGPMLRGELVEISAVSAATENGKPAVGIVVRLPDGKLVGAWTTHALFNGAARVFAAKHGDPS